MKNNIKHINDLKCIKVTLIYENKQISERLTYNQYYKSFVVERWQGERRTNKKHTMFGYWHTKTTVKNPYNNEKSVRVFEFPENEDHARQLDAEYFKELGA